MKEENSKALFFLDQKTVRLAIPNKGRISSPVLDLLEKSGLHINDTGTRRLIAKTSDPHVDVLYARPSDIPEYVATGAADLGITGHDLVIEHGSHVLELLDLKLGQARLILAVRQDFHIRTKEELVGKNIATEFPNITAEYLKKNGIQANVLHVTGACEVTPYLVIADAIVDLTSSGTKLAENRLTIIDEVMKTSTMVIANPHSREVKSEKIDEVLLALESVVSARGQCYLMLNVEREKIKLIEDVLPGLSGPTIMDVASNEGLVAVHSVVPEDQVFSLITQLKKAGAKDILVMPVARMVR